MQGVLRTWACQNKRCRHTFDAWENYPYCPRCGSAKCNWVPGGGHIMDMARKADAAFRDLADVYGMTDIASAKEGERAMPKLQRPAHDQGRQHTFAPGFSGTPFVLDANGGAHAVCQPSSTGVHAKVKAEVGKPLGRSGSVPGPLANTRFEGSYKG